jgi:hypothetical protein
LGLLKKKRKSSHGRTAARRLPKLQIGCGFCWEWLPLPRSCREVFSGDGCVGGRCECGAVYVIDETGREGGQAQLDALAMVCDGDLDRAVRLHVDRDVELKTRDLGEREGDVGHHSPTRGPLPAKVWFARLKGGEAG